MSEKRPTQPILDKDALWDLLVEAAHSLPMYNNHKRYVSEVMIKEKPDITYRELAVVINIPVGEALVILAETRDHQLSRTDASKGTREDRSILDYSK
jgi:hypothetical protein